MKKTKKTRKRRLKSLENRADIHGAFLDSHSEGLADHEGRLQDYKAIIAKLNQDAKAMNSTLAHLIKWAVETKNYIPQPGTQISRRYTAVAVTDSLDDRHFPDASASGTDHAGSSDDASSADHAVDIDPMDHGRCANPECVLDANHPPIPCDLAGTEVPPIGTVIDLLGMIGISVDETHIRGEWTDTMILQAAQYATQQHLIASDNIFDEDEIIERPWFLTPNKRSKK